MDFIKSVILIAMGFLSFISATEKPPIVTIEGKPGEVIPSVNDNVIVKCKSFVANGAKPKLSGTANMVTLIVNDKTQMEKINTRRYSKVAGKMSEIKIAGIKPADGGFYACVGAPHEGFGVSPSIELTVRDSPTVTMEGVREGQVIKVKEMDELPIDCKASGKYKNTKLTVKIGEQDVLPKLNKTSSFNWNPTSSEGPTQMNPRWTGSAKGKVEIGVKDHDMKVVCKASVGSPKLDKSFSFTLNVEANPRKMNCTVDKTIIELGDKVTYSCRFASKPVPKTVLWNYKLNDGEVFNLTSPGINEKKTMTTKQMESGKTHIEATLSIEYKYRYMLEMEDVTLKVVNSYGLMDHVFPQLTINLPDNIEGSAMSLRISLGTVLICLLAVVSHRF
ncbi:uncharacterized protein LOC141900205 [Tubulanus polymorphus]|uniref:uncharacterized protein LOC141900205 n=1 Tax=Tubulanus polymorphus TaxID=672921 RepID=UPI003DA5D351